MSGNLDTIAATLRAVDRTVWVITAQAGQRRGGLTATNLWQTSIDPSRPTCLLSLGKNHYTRELVDEAGGFIAHLLRPDQFAVALHFAIGTGRDRDKLAGLVAEHGSDAACHPPALADCAARLTASVYHRLDAGDRVFYFADFTGGNPPHGSVVLTEKLLIAAATGDQRAALRANMDADITLGRPLADAWRASLPRG